tara:strand:- start:4605 stop:5741 length:1137 start_codon:yes stop_codon:yes gene_type:complete
MTCDINGSFISEVCKSTKSSHGLFEAESLNFLTDLKENDVDTVKIVHNGQTFLQSGEPKFISTGSYGNVFKINLANVDDASQVIPIAYKVSKSDQELEETHILQRYPIFTDQICPYIIPIKEINKKIYMPLGDGDLATLKSTKLPFGTAHKIVSCLERTLVCLKQHGCFYFDLKGENVIFKCNKESLVVWLADIGSILPDVEDEFTCSYPHPLYPHPTDPGFIQKSIYENDESLWSLYAYLLTLMFCYLVFEISFSDLPFYSMTYKEKMSKLKKLHNLCLSNPELKEKYPRYCNVLQDIVMNGQKIHTNFWVRSTEDKTTPKLSKETVEHANKIFQDNENIHQRFPKNKIKKTKSKIGTRMLSSTYVQETDQRLTKSA